jgi:hypothetical protein
MSCRKLDPCRVAALSRQAHLLVLFCLISTATLPNALSSGPRDQKWSLEKSIARHGSMFCFCLLDVQIAELEAVCSRVEAPALPFVLDPQLPNHSSSIAHVVARARTTPSSRFSCKQVLVCMLLDPSLSPQKLQSPDSRTPTPLACMATRSVHMAAFLVLAPRPLSLPCC